MSIIYTKESAAFLGPWPLGSLAQSMHKRVVHAQEISCFDKGFFCMHTRDLSCIHKRFFCVSTRDISLGWPMGELGLALGGGRHV